ncbi:unnamed protein product [Parascedosporium putredinis]|uniref:Uncharacterized protein n=1 Tax=Parascedosporium putredinis TaxID=1442378 RepID=A0A9P1H5R7_9PEZI|nr:unnamed protein product [Parascedosporium putredinis]CAI7996764.1 unnamed protein product [Parascedosporium putredinis]
MTSAYNCSAPPDSIEPYGDIAGLGVMYSYLITGWMVCVLAFADIQLFTGLALLISGYAMIPKGLSSYHWLLVVQLAWFSSLTHLSMLSFLRNYLVNNPKAMRIRGFFTFPLGAMLMVGFIFTGFFDWERPDNKPSQYTRCHLEGPSMDIKSEVCQFMIIRVLLLVYSYAIRAAKMRLGCDSTLRGKAKGFALHSFQPKLMVRVQRLTRMNSPKTPLKTLAQKENMIETLWHL